MIATLGRQTATPGKPLEGTVIGNNQLPYINADGLRFHRRPVSRHRYARL